MTITTAHVSNAASGGSFVDDLQLQREPRQKLGRLFLDAEARLAEHDITLRRASFADLVDLHVANKSSWRALAECFDPRVRTVRDDAAACFVGYDRGGVAVTSIAVVHEALGDRCVRDAFEDLTFWFGENANLRRAEITCRVPAESAGKLRGNVFYPGAFWVHPSRRGQGFGYILPEIARFYALSQWDCAYEIGVASIALRRPDVQRYSHFQHHEESFSLRSAETVMYEGLFLWSDMDHLHRRLDRHCRLGISADGLVDKIRNQQPVRAYG